MRKIRAFLAALAVIGEAVEAVEALFPRSGAGRFKLSAVLEIVKVKLGDFADLFDDIQPAIIRVIDLVVAAKNELGDWFQAADESETTTENPQ